MMKLFKLKLVFMSALLSMFVCKAFAGGNLITEQVTVTITNGEYLSELIKADDAPLITNLKIVGNIDGTDIAYLRELMGVGKYYGMDKEKVKSNLHILDLSMGIYVKVEIITVTTPIKVGGIKHIQPTTVLRHICLLHATP